MEPSKKTGPARKPASIAAKIRKLHGVSYEWKDARKTGREFGVIAQDVKKVFPELVTKDDSGFLKVDYRGLIPVLIEGWKELDERVALMEKRLKKK